MVIHYLVFARSLIATFSRVVHRPAKACAAGGSSQDSTSLSPASRVLAVADMLAEDELRACAGPGELDSEGDPQYILLVPCTSGLALVLRKIIALLTYGSWDHRPLSVPVSLQRDYSFLFSFFQSQACAHRA